MPKVVRHQYPDIPWTILVLEAYEENRNMDTGGDGF